MTTTTLVSARYSIWSIGPGREDDHVIDDGGWEDIEGAARAARSYARDDARDGGTTVQEDCATSPDDMAAFGARDRDDLPIYVVREAAVS